MAHAADRDPSGIMPALHENFGIKGDLTAADTGNKPRTVQESLAARQESPYVDAHPSYVEGLKAVGNNEDAQGRFSIEYIERKAAEALSALQKPQIEPSLIASNIPPGVPDIEEFQQHEDAQSGSDFSKGDATLAKNLREDALGTDIVRVAVPSGSTDRAIFHYRGSEDLRLADCTKHNPHAWGDAFSAYPKLAEYLSTSDGPRLMQALVRNELHWYDPKDMIGDVMARAGKADYTETLGYAQITPKGVNEFETGVINGQRVRPPDTQLTKFLEGKGHSGTGHEAKALEDPSCVPMLIAAKLNTLIQAYEKTETPINTRTLAYGYNADVYYNPSKAGSYHAATYPGADSVEKRLGNVKAFPIVAEEALNASVHLRNVESHMEKIQ